MEKRQYEIIRSKRKSISLQILPDCRMVVRAPLSVGEREIDRFVQSKEAWIVKWLNQLEKRRQEKKTVILSTVQVTEIKRRGRAYLEKRCRQFAEKMGVSYGKIRLNSARTRWGSCNSKGDLNFAYRLLLAEPDLIDYVIVHELAHRRYMDHSARFWAVVAKAMPDYKERKARLTAFQHQVEIVEEERCS